MALVALVSFSFYSCGDDVEGVENDPTGGVSGGGQVSSKSIVGTWEMTTEGGTAQLILTDKKFTMIQESDKTEGTYTTKGDKITLTPEKFYEKSPNTGAWIETKPEDGDDEPATMKVQLLKDNNVLIATIEEVYDEEFAQQEDPFFLMFYRKGANINASSSELQGKWQWSLRGNKEIVRAFVEFKGNNFDLIIPAWRERYQGTYTYQNGMVQFNTTDFTTREWQEEGNESLKYLYTGWRSITAEEQQWGYGPSFGMKFNRAFIAVGKQGYTYLANMPAIFEKQ